MPRGLAGTETRTNPSLWPTGTSASHEILAAARSAEARSHIAGALGGLAQVRFLPSLASLEPSNDPDERPPLAAVLYLDAQRELADGRAWVAGIESLRARWAETPVIAYAPYSADVMAQILEAGRAGAEHLVVRGMHDLAASLCPILERRSADPMVRAIIGAVVDARGTQLRGPALLALRYAIEHVREHLTVTHLSAGVALSPRMLCNHLAAAHLPSPERLIMWSRLLAFAWIRQAGACSVNRGAALLGFGSASALRHLVESYVGCAPDTLRGPSTLTRIARAMLDPEARQR